MKTSFTFNSKTSARAVTDSDYNRGFIECMINLINEYYSKQGYIYLNTIYEHFGVKWDPEWENLCFIYEDGRSLKFGIARANGDGFDIDLL